MSSQRQSGNSSLKGGSAGLDKRCQALSRIRKVLEAGNIRLSSIASNVVGTSVGAVLGALAEGT